MNLRNILYATDYSELSQSALGWATSLARDSGATLLIVHVSDMEDYPVGELFSDERPSDAPREVVRLKSVVPSDPEVAHEHHLLHAKPPDQADEIVKMARERHVDLIVIGAHGRSGLSKLLAGSTAETILRTAPCPVLAVKQPHEARVNA